MRTADTALHSGKAHWQLRQGGKEETGIKTTKEENQTAEKELHNSLTGEVWEESVDHPVVDRPGLHNLGPAVSKATNEGTEGTSNLRRGVDDIHRR